MAATSTGASIGLRVVVSTNEAAVAPALTVTAAGTLTSSGSALRSATVAPPSGAGPLRVILPVALPPARTSSGAILATTRRAGSTTSSADCVLRPTAAVIETGLLAATGVVVIGNVAESAPGVTVTLAGTAASAGLSLASDTTAPSPGAAAASVTVPTAGWPPVTLAGASASERSATAANTRAGWKVRTNASSQTPDRRPLSPGMRVQPQRLFGEEALSPFGALTAPALRVSWRPGGR